MLLGFDFESYYDTEYSLSKMDPPSYILDPRWETIGCSFKEDEKPAFFVDGPDVGKYVATHDPAKTTTYAFNALFDNCILAWHYGFVPTRMYCTMRLAVAIEGHKLKAGASLRSVGRHLQIGEKGTTIESARGLHRSDMLTSPVFWQEYQDYANNDNEMNHDILFKLIPRLPTAERRLMDRVLRCAVEPQFLVDTVMLRQHLKDLRREKWLMLVDAGAPDIADILGNLALDEDEVERLVDERMEPFCKKLRSNARFEEVLKANGIEVQYKQSITNPEVRIPAFAKTDDFMAMLLEHPDPDVQALASARVGLRSTIEQSRGERILNIAELEWARYRDGNPRLYSGGTLPVPLKFSGAHTHRLSGDWSLNLQNLPAGRGTNKSKLRLSLVAPPGHKVVVADKSQIECRINALVCGQQDLLDIFTRNGDPYSVLASAIFEFKVDKNINKTERFIGKGGVLGLGFGCGAEKFFNMVVRQARTLGMDMKALMKIWTPQLARKSVDIYRIQNGAIVATWRKLDSILITAWLGITEPVKWGPVVIGHGYVEGPNGLRMNYANPRRDPETDELLFDYGRRTFKMYGSKFLENIVQFLARINTMNDALRISDRTGYNFVLQSHDELAWIVPEDKAVEHLRIAIEEMRRPPSWAPGLPLGAEGNIGNSYGEAK